MAPARDSSRTESWYRAVVAALFAWVIGAGFYLAWTTGSTTDERIHVSSAYIGLVRGEYRFDPEHPFLFKDLTALPLFALKVRLPSNDRALWNGAAPTFYDSWREARLWGDEFFYESGNDAALITFLSRIPGVLSLIALCALVFFLSRLWFSKEVAIWALAFTAFSPTLFGHGVLANNDVPVALAVLASVWALWKYGSRPNLASAAVAGAVIAITVLTKYSGLGILPVALVWLIYLIRKRKVSGRAALLHTLVVLAICWVATFTVYFWHSPVLVTRQYDLPQNNRDLLGKLGISESSALNALRWVLPSAYLKGLYYNYTSVAKGRPSFLLDHLYGRGVWFYFPVLFALKTQVAALALLATGLFWRIRGRRPAEHMTFVERRNQLKFLLLATTLVYGAMILASKLNIGFRHAAPLLPLFSLFLALAVVRLRAYWRWLIGAAYLAPVLWQFNNLIGFSNVLVWPHDKAYLYFSDSNLDWGQQTREIVQVAKRRYAGEPIYMDYSWDPVGLRYYGLNFLPVDPEHLPDHGVIVVTASQLSADAPWRRFRNYKPDYVLMNNTFFYRADRVPR